MPIIQTDGAEVYFEDKGDGPGAPMPGKSSRVFAARSWSSCPEPAI